MTSSDPVNLSDQDLINAIHYLSKVVPVGTHDAKLLYDLILKFEAEYVRRKQPR